MLSRLEQETLVSFNEAEPLATISTFNGALIRKLTRLAQERPEECKLVREFSEGEKRFVFPRKWLKVNAGLVLSEEQKAQRAEQGRKAFAQLHGNAS